MNLFISYISVLVLISQIKLSSNDATFEIRFDMETIQRVSLRPRPVHIISKTRACAQRYCRNFRDIFNACRSQSLLTIQARNLIAQLENLTNQVCRASIMFFNNNYMTVWYNRLRRYIEINYIQKDNLVIIDKFLETMKTKKAPKCWNKARKRIQNIIQFKIVTVSYDRIEAVLLETYLSYQNESQVYRDNVLSNTGSCSRFVSILKGFKKS